MVKRKPLSQATRQAVWGLALGVCMKPDCRKDLAGDGSSGSSSRPIGEIAHIAAASPDGPRGNAPVPLDQRDAPDNLILLCPNHHREVDNNPDRYTYEELRRWRREHLDWRECVLNQGVPQVSFAELEILLRAIASNGRHGGGDLSLTALDRKIRRNDLRRSHDLIKIGLVKVEEVRMYVGKQEEMLSDFGARLSAGFAKAYLEAREDGLRGDDLFDAMHMFASQGRREFRYQAAGLAVLVYLFEKCEVFER